MAALAPPLTALGVRLSVRALPALCGLLPTGDGTSASSTADSFKLPFFTLPWTDARTDLLGVLAGDPALALSAEAVLKCSPESSRLPLPSKLSLLYSLEMAAGRTLPCCEADSDGFVEEATLLGGTPLLYLLDAELAASMLALCWLLFCDDVRVVARVIEPGCSEGGAGCVLALRCEVLREAPVAVLDDTPLLDLLDAELAELVLASGWLPFCDDLRVVAGVLDLSCSEGRVDCVLAVRCETLRETPVAVLGAREAVEGSCVEGRGELDSTEGLSSSVWEGGKSVAKEKPRDARNCCSSWSLAEVRGAAGSDVRRAGRAAAADSGRSCVVEWRTSWRSEALLGRGRGAELGREAAPLRAAARES